MSFYQPSLSLYDVLNALSNQAPANRDPREQLFRSRGYAPQPSGYGSFGGGVPSGLPSGLIYRLPGDTCYYRPDYYYTGEDDDEEEEEELEEAERAQRFQQQQQQQQQRGYEHFPSYYHSRAPKGGVQETLEESDPLTELVGALLGNGAVAPSYERIPPQVPSRRNTVNEDNLFKQALLDKLGQQAQQEDATAAATAAAAAAENEDRQEQQASVSEKGSEPEEQAPSKPKEKLPFPLNRKPSLLGAQANSSAPGGPLQVSKPEARLDLPFSPEVNVYDCPDQYVVAIALPGATSKGFKVDYHPSTHELILKGDIEDKLGIGEEYLKVTELKYGAFQRTIKFPVTPRIRDEEIKASYKNGILQVKVPKILESNEKPAPKKRIIIEDVPDEELEYEEHHGLPLQS